MEDNNFNNGYEFEDIVSDTTGTKIPFDGDFEYFDTYSDSKHFKKNRRGIKRILNIGDWWRERKKWQKGLMISATALILVVAILATVVFTVFDYNYRNITKKPEDLGFEQVIDAKIINVALFGIDTRDEKSFKGLSDSIMILSLNTETKKVKIISVMRDSLVPITYNGKTSYNKINSAYNKGPEIAIKTLNTIFGLDISEYATVNFFGMAEIIEAVGGIEAELTDGEVNGYHGINDCLKEICKEMGVSSKKYLIKKSGKQKLNGVQAVAYSRIRYQRNIWGTSDDFGRTDRQRYVMEQLFNKALTLNKSQYVKLAKALIPYAETSLSYSEIMGLATSILLHSPTFEQTRVPLTEYTMPSKSVSGAGSCVYYDLDYAKKIVHAFIYDNISPEDYMEQNGIEKNDWYAGTYYTPPSGSGGNSSSSSGSGSSSSESTTSWNIPSSDTPTVSDPSEPLEPTDPSEPIDSDPDTSSDDATGEPSSDIGGTDSSGITGSGSSVSSGSESGGNTSGTSSSGTSGNTSSTTTSGTPSQGSVS